MHKLNLEDNEAQELDYYLRWKWPTQIETTLRRMIWISLVENSEAGEFGARKHTTYLRSLIASSPKSPPQVLDLLANLKDQDILSLVAANPRTSPDTLARLARNEELSVSLVNNPGFREKARLVRHAELEDRRAQARGSALRTRRTGQSWNASTVVPGDTKAS